MTSPVLLLLFALPVTIGSSSLTSSSFTGTGSTSFGSARIGTSFQPFQPRATGWGLPLPLDEDELDPVGVGTADDDAADGSQLGS